MVMQTFLKVSVTNMNDDDDDDAVFKLVSGALLQ